MTARSAPAADPSAAAIDAACAHLERFGYCVFEGAMPEAEAGALAQRCLELHEDPACREHIHGRRPYETLFGLLNREDRVWDFAAHPLPVGVARRLLGPDLRIGEAVSKPTWRDPDQPIGLHVDSAQGFHGRVPDLPWLINSMWMLTDFTDENGATGLVPMSHLARRREPYPGIGYDHPFLRPITGRRGSLFLWHGGVFHTARPNRTDQVRVGLNISYYPSWFNVYAEGGHQPVWPETYARMPAAMRALCRSRRGRTRAEVYEDG